MRNALFYVFITTSILFGVAGSCGKDGGGGGGNPPPGGEATLVATTNPPNNSTQPASVDVDFPVRIIISSTMPPQGVTVDVTSRIDDGSGTPAFFSTSINTSATTIDVTITGTPLNVICLVNVTITSRSTLTNKWLGSYRYSRK